MKLSWQWLQEFVEIPNVTAETVGDKLTLHTAELEEIIECRDKFEKVILGELTSIESHNDSDKLSVAQFDLGAHGKKQIIFGKVHEVAVGEILPVAIAGARLGSGINIEENKIRGVLSQGMIADNAELGLKQPGLLRFSDKKLIGKSLPEVITTLGDTLFDIDNKSLTHRPDLVGHRGFARELSAIFDTKLILPEPVVSLPDLKNGLEAEIKTKSCRRFCGLRIENVQVKPSALEIQMRLENLGVRAISNLVDITNCIMLEYGQPMHVFDADKVEGDIVVRPAKFGETLEALDGETYELTTDDMVIADQKKALSIAGIMGGMFSSVTGSTTNVIFESANFDPVMVRKTSQRLGLRSESSMRYEKSLDPEQCRKALMGAAEMALNLCPGAVIASKVVDAYPNPPAPITVSVSLEKIQTISGVDIDQKSVDRILNHLGFARQGNTISVPSWRSTKDVSIAEDIVEEVVRLYGLDKVPTILPSFSVEPPVKNKMRDLQWQCRDQWAARGYLETYLHSFLVTETFKGHDLSEYEEVANPLSEAYRYLRRDLWPQMLAKLESELRRHKQVQFFELGKVYHKNKNTVLPTEKEKLLVVRASLETHENDDFFVVKADAEAWLKQLGISSYHMVPGREVPENFHPAKTLQIEIEGQIIGYLGVLHPKHLPVKGTSLVVLELDLAPVLAIVESREIKHTAQSTFPEVHRDISLIIAEKSFAADLIQTAQSSSELLREIKLFDEYKDDHKIGPGLKNLAFHLHFQASDRTLTESEIEIELDKVVTEICQTHKAKLRIDNV